MIKLAALAVLSLVPVVMVGGDPLARHVPVLVLEVTDPCKCAPSVVPYVVGPFLKTCSFGGNPQPCFTAQVISNPEDVSGTCEAPGVAGEPPLPACGPRKPCVFDSREVRVVAAPCADDGSCGTSPFQGLNQNGEDFGEKFTQGGYFDVKVVIGNRSCGSTPKSYDIKVKDGGDGPGDRVVFTYRLDAICAQCPRLKP